MDTPTWRGAYDRFLILPQGRLNIIDFDFYRRVAEEGIPERKVWKFSWGGRSRFDPVWDMVLEGSTGFSGSLGRQVTLNSSTTEDSLSNDLLDALERSSSEGAVVLQAEGLVIEEGKARSVILQYDATLKGGSYVETTKQRNAFSRDRLLSWRMRTGSWEPLPGGMVRTLITTTRSPAFGPKARLRNNVEPRSSPSFPKRKRPWW